MTPTPATSPRPVTPAVDPIDWEALAQRLRRYSLALTRDVHEAEDLAQQTIAAMLLTRSSAESKPPADPDAYAITVATRRWISQQRSFKRLAARLARFSIGRPAWSEPAATNLERFEDQQRADRAIRALPPLQRAIFVLRVIEGQDYAAIAQTLGCEVGAVRSSLHLARARLRQALGEPDEPATTPSTEPASSERKEVRRV